MFSRSTTCPRTRLPAAPRPRWGRFAPHSVPDPDAELAIAIAQGVDMGRPSQIRLQVRKAGGVVRQVVVAGECVPVMRGELVVDLKIHQLH